jgi:ankyrin repeat protein
MTFDEIHRLIKKGDVVGLRHELDAGVSPNLCNHFAWTLLMLASLEGNTSAGRLLISRGAERDVANDFGETALSLAAQKGHAPFVRLMLESGAPKICRPHGHSLEDWVRVLSALPPAKIASILDLINTTTPQK